MKSESEIQSPLTGNMFTDGVHLISDVSEFVLHFYADKFGIHPCHFHRGSRYPHYDLPKKFRNKNFYDKWGIKVISSREIIEILKKSRQIT